MNPEDFSVGALGKLVPSVAPHPRTREPERAQAFVPHPIPRDIPLGSSSMRKLEGAVAALSMLTGALDRRPINIEMLLRPLKRREAIVSSEIEGTVTTTERLLILEAGGQPMPDIHDQNNSATREVLNHVGALDHAEQALETTALSLNLIRDMHQILLAGGVRGETTRPGHFRNYQNWIGTGECSIRDATFVPPPPDRLQPLLDDLERYIHEEPGPVLVQAAMVHYQFETIHPFADGNGRIGRLLFALLPYAHKMTPRPMLYVSPYFDRHRDQYAQLLYRVSAYGELVPWIEFFLDAVVEESNAMTSKVGEILDLRNDFDRRVNSERGASARLHSLVEFIVGRPVFSSVQAREHINTTQQTTSYSLKRLTELGIIHKLDAHDSRENWFYCPELIAVMR